MENDLPLWFDIVASLLGIGIIGLMFLTIRR